MPYQLKPRHRVPSRCALALLLSAPLPSSAQVVQIDDNAARRVLATSEVTFRSARTERRSLDALADSLVAIAIQPASSESRLQGASHLAVIRLGIAGSDPKIDYRGAAPRLLKIALESTDGEAAAMAVRSLRNMTDTTAAVAALQQLAMHPTHSFSAVSKLGLNYWSSAVARDALLSLYAKRTAIPDRTARDYVEERVRYGGLLRKP